MANRFNPESLNAALDVLSMLKERAADAERRGDSFTFGVMNKLVKVVSPIVTQAHSRLIREEKAEMNRRHQKLRENAGGKMPFRSEE